jgi:hypothetical protein
MQPRRSTQLGTTPVACGICGHEEQVVAETRAVRQGFARLNPFFDSRPRTYEVCPGCGARQLQSAV